MTSGLQGAKKVFDDEESSDDDHNLFSSVAQGSSLAAVRGVKRTQSLTVPRTTGGSLFRMSSDLGRRRTIAIDKPIAFAHPPDLGTRRNQARERRTTFVETDSRVELRNQRVLEELADLEMQLHERGSRPEMKRIKQFLEFIVVARATKRLCDLFKEHCVGGRARAAAAAILNRLFVPVWKLHRRKRHSRAEKIIQNFLVKVVSKKRRAQRHRSIDLIHKFLKTKMRYLRCVFKWYVVKVKMAQRMLRLMMARRQAQVELNYRKCRQIEEKEYWQAAWQGSKLGVTAAIRRREFRRLPQLLLRDEVRRLVSEQCRDYHREQIRRESAIRQLEVEAKKNGGLTVKSMKMRSLLISKKLAYSAFLSKEKCFLALDNVCRATAAIREDPTWSEHLTRTSTPPPRQSASLE